MTLRAFLPALAALSVVFPETAFAAEFDGRTLGFAWALPFIGILLSIALLPLLAPHAWEHHQGKIAALWALAGARSRWPLVFGPATGASRARPHGAPRIHPLHPAAARAVHGGGRHPDPRQHPWRARHQHGAARDRRGARERHRHHRRFHGDDPPGPARQRRPQPQRPVVVFFIFLVSNIGGSLTPLGDPPLFLGFLRGVDFFWTTHASAARDPVRRRHRARRVLRWSTWSSTSKEGRVAARSDARTIRCA